MISCRFRMRQLVHSCNTQNVHSPLFPHHESRSSSASNFWSDPVGYGPFSVCEEPSLGPFFCPIRPPTRATNILIFSSSCANSPSRVIRFGWIFRCGSRNGSRRRCNRRSSSRRRCRCCRCSLSSVRRSRSCRYLHVLSLVWRNYNQ